MLKSLLVLNEITSGGATINDTFFHGAIPTIPFGGVGDSGHGAYRGKASFDTFTHRRTVVTTPSWMEKLLDIRYPPYAGKLPSYRLISKRRPNFDRQGNEFRGMQYWLGFVFQLGGKSKNGVLLRWVATVLLVITLKKYAGVGKPLSYLQ